MGISSDAPRRPRPGRDDGLPAGQRAAGAGLVRPRRRARRGRPRPGDPRGRPAGRGPRLQRGRRHQGDAAAPPASTRSSAPTEGCFAAFKAVYECTVPVVAAVNGFCLGGGVGLVGNADTVVASDDAYFGVPEVDRGALGAATHLARLVPPAPDAHALLHRPHDHRDRPGRPRQRPRGGPPRPARRRGARRSPARSRPRTPGSSAPPRRRSTASTRSTSTRSYRFEQGFTMELNLAGVSDELRDDFVGTSRSTGADKATRSDRRRATSA